MSRWPTRPQCGALTGLALLLAATAFADEQLREQVRNEYRHQNYMLVEYADGAWLYLFTSDASEQPAQLLAIDSAAPFLGATMAKTRSADPRDRVRGLTELAGADAPEALDAALSLLTDPDIAVREEAAHLILDHPDGSDLAAALGLVDEDASDE